MIVKIPSHSVAPRRQAATITSLKTLPSVQAANLPVFPIPSGIEKPPLAEAEGTDNVNPVFEAIRALGTATLIVTATAFTGFWAVRTSMDVKNVCPVAFNLALILTFFPYCVFSNSPGSRRQ